MHQPDFKAAQLDWQKWADEHYPFDGRDIARAVGFDIVRAIKDRDFAADMALALCRGLAPRKPDPVDRIPPPPDYGYEPLFGYND